jgi:hypothetical protein
VQADLVQSCKVAETFSDPINDQVIHAIHPSKKGLRRWQPTQANASYGLISPDFIFSSNPATSALTASGTPA